MKRSQAVLILILSGIAAPASRRTEVRGRSRWARIQHRDHVHVNGANVGRVKSDPWVWGAAVGYRF